MSAPCFLKQELYNILFLAVGLKLFGLRRKDLKFIDLVQIGPAIFLEPVGPKR